jgi:tetratricopeptide (TPR) repeat protein
LSAELDRIEQIRQLGLAKFRANEHEEAVALFDQALALVTDEETRELLTVNKAGALIFMSANGPEVQRLPQIIMRRRNPRLVLLAAYYLGKKHEDEKDFKRSGFYHSIAHEMAAELGDRGWLAATCVTLGNVAVFDSRTDDAIVHLEAALEMLEDSPEQAVTRAFAMQNLGYCRLVNDDIDAGVALIHQAVEQMQASGADKYAAESYIDLCMGYLEKGEYETARHFGEMGLEQATEVRQVRNAHYLLGEVAFKSGDVTLAEFHFDHLASHYPDFPNLKNLLYAIDLRKVVNFKL